MKRIGIYVRVSTAEQAEKGYSIETQLQASRQKAAECGGAVISEFVDEGFSGEFIDRPALTRLRESVASKLLDMVIVYDPDRLARNLAHQLIITEEIEVSGAELIFVSVTFEHSPEGRLFYSIRGAVAAYEKEKIKERTNRGKRGKLATGKIISNQKPFGYDWDAVNSTYIINNEQAEIVRWMYHWVNEEKASTAIVAQRLNELGIPSPRAKKSWAVSTVYTIMTNPIYKGTHIALRHRYQKISNTQRTKSARPPEDWIEIAVPAIVDLPVWEASQKQFKENKSLARRNLKHDQLLTNLIYCRKCGHKMTITYSGRKDTPVSYYVCATQRNREKKDCCDARRIPSGILDETVWQYLQSVNQNPEVICELLKQQPTKARNELEHMLLKVTENEKRMIQRRDIIMKWFRQQVISDQEAEEQLKEIKRQLADIQESRKRHQQALLAASSELHSDDAIAATIHDILRQDKVATASKRAAIRALLDKIYVERLDTTRGRGSLPEFTIELKFL